MVIHFALKRTLRVGSFLLLILAYGMVCPSRKMDIILSVPIDSTEFKVVTAKLLGLQNKIKKAACQKGYCFNTHLNCLDTFHITLETAKRAAQDDYVKYEKCTEAMIRNATSFDLTTPLKQAKLGFMGGINDWAVLELSVKREDVLPQLARHIRKSFKKSNLKVGKYSEFIAHVSLGKFTQDNKVSLPEDLSWVIHEPIELPQGSFIVKNILLQATRVDDLTGKMQRKQTFYSLPESDGTDSSYFPVGKEESP
ncbi:MAG: hypothetical protein P4L31_05505 [Candidatus Babeliales bacterium]|nr:hypothetical protein [Candidatus Babeliales bacterium]